MEFEKIWGIGITVDRRCDYKFDWGKRAGCFCYQANLGVFVYNFAVNSFMKKTFIYYENPALDNTHGMS